MPARRVVIVGGGAAGMLAAGAAGLAGAKTTLLEKGPKLGRKIRITGKGRCNITNAAEVARFIEAFAPNGPFLYGAFSRFFSDDLRRILRDNGVETKVERGGRVFPESDEAADCAEALAQWAERCGVVVKLNTRVRSIIVADGRVSGVEIFGGAVPAEAVIVATGGLSYPKTGSTGDGYAWATELGHAVVPTRPALSGLVCAEKWATELAGLGLRNVEATVLTPAGKVLGTEFGEMLFTHFGVSGPIILTLSRWVARLPSPAAARTRTPLAKLSIDLKPALSAEDLHARLIRDFRQSRNYANVLKGLMPQSLGERFAPLSCIDPGRPVNKITAEERRTIVDLLKALPLIVLGLRPIEEAIVTAGGVDLREVDPRTMESKRVGGLYFAGEVLDLDGETGGFNLQAAFSTGFVAGSSAAQGER